MFFLCAGLIDIIVTKFVMFHSGGNGLYSLILEKACFNMPASLLTSVLLFPSAFHLGKTLRFSFRSSCIIFLFHKIEVREPNFVWKQLLPLIPVQHKLLGKTFTIQIKKLFAKHKDASLAKLFIMSITEKDIASNLPLPLTAPTTPESSKCKLMQIMTKED
ncbi:hypothetical protein RDI58_022422 [Solanum bulbocastanum]|uniref:Uncharacterized protein n=1 Tax=Solanum bulbocastanum TaxID=147425 RepID=A0AAN8Y824_SOLBU